MDAAACHRILVRILEIVIANSINTLRRNIWMLLLATEFLQENKTNIFLPTITRFDETVRMLLLCMGCLTWRSRCAWFGLKELTSTRGADQ